MSQKTLAEADDLELIAELRRRDPSYSVFKWTEEQMRQMRLSSAAPGLPAPSYLYFPRTDSVGGKY